VDEVTAILLGVQVLIGVVKALSAGHGVSEEQMKQILDFEAQVKAKLIGDINADLAAHPDQSDVAAALARANHGT
jgi:hypothetical protein